MPTTTPQVSNEPSSTVVAKGKKKIRRKIWKTFVANQLVPHRNVLTIWDNLTHVVSLDCEMVGVGSFGNILSLARVSLVNEDGDIILDMYVQPTTPVTRFYPKLNGITAEHMKIAVQHQYAVDELRKVLEGRTVVGHSLKCDFRVIFGEEQLPLMYLEDIGESTILRELVNIRTAKGGLKKPSLREMAETLLGRTIQSNAHSSVEDARAALDAYKVLVQKRPNPADYL